MGLKVLISIVLISCFSNALIFELLIKEDPGVGNLVTFMYFLSISFIGFITVGKFGTAQRHIPLSKYFVLVLLFWTSSVANNWVFTFNIQMPLHMVFRSGTLITNMLMSVKILKKRYTLAKYFQVLIITFGIIICTIESSIKVHTLNMQPSLDKHAMILYIEWLWWCVGIAILTLALFVSARMGIFQECLFVQFGKHPLEALFYTHLLPLPLWIPTLPNLLRHFNSACNTVVIQICGVFIPRQVLYLVIYVLTQAFCISSVYMLSAEASSLTVCMTVTLRKFLSLIFSVYYFENTFTVRHWIGAAFVFIGTLLYAEVYPSVLFVKKLKTKTM